MPLGATALLKRDPGAARAGSGRDARSVAVRVADAAGNATVLGRTVVLRR